MAASIRTTQQPLPSPTKDGSITLAAAVWIVLSTLGQSACVNALRLYPVGFVSEHIEHSADLGRVEVEPIVVLDPVAKVHEFGGTNFNLDWMTLVTYKSEVAARPCRRKCHPLDPGALETDPEISC